MHPLLLWFLVYVLPVGLSALAVYIAHRLCIKKIDIGIAAFCIGLTTSILLIHSFLENFTLSTHLYSIILCIITIIIAITLLGYTGIGYAFASFLQQLTIFSITTLLLLYYPWFIVMLLVVPVYSFAHLIERSRWKLKVVLTLCWGVLSILLYIQFSDLFLNTALHLLAGIFLIKKRIIYAKRYNE